MRAVQGSLKTHEDRTLFFDFLQLELGRVGGLSPKIQLYTLPGQAYYEASRKLLLRGADGVVFVADSSEDHLQGNIQFWRKMLEHLTSLGMNPQTIPVVLQCNKQDLPNAVPAARSERARRNTSAGAATANASSKSRQGRPLRRT